MDFPLRLTMPLYLCVLASGLAVVQAPARAQEPAAPKQAQGTAPAAPSSAAEGPLSKTTIRRNPDGSIAAYVIGAEGASGEEKATIDYTPDSRTIDYGAGEGGKVTESYYNVGVRKEVITSDGDHRKFMWEHLKPKTETHLDGVWKGVLIT